MLAKRAFLATSAAFLLSSPDTHAQAPTLQVGTNDAGAPWSFHDPATNTERGIAVELIQAIAAQSNFRVEFVRLTLPELIPALNAGKLDIIAANLLITQERQAQVDFSDAIAPGGDGLVVPTTDAKPYATLEDLKDLALATQAGPFAEALRKTGLFPGLKVFPNGTQAMQSVAAGAHQAAIVGINGAAYELKLGHFPQLQLARSYRPMVSSVDAFSVRRGNNALRQQINTALASLHANGTVKRILTEYGQ